MSCLFSLLTTSFSYVMMMASEDDDPAMMVEDEESQTWEDLVKPDDKTDKDVSETSIHDDNDCSAQNEPPVMMTMHSPKRQRFTGDRSGLLTRAASQGQEELRRCMWQDTLEGFRTPEATSSVSNKGPSDAVVELGHRNSCPELGYGDSSPDLGYGDSSPTDLGYGDGAPTRSFANNDLGYHSDHVPRKQLGSFHRRCSVTKFSLQASSAKAQAELALEEKRRFLERQESMRSGCFTECESDDDDEDYSDSFGDDSSMDYDSEIDAEEVTILQMPMAA